MGLHRKRTWKRGKCVRVVPSEVIYLQGTKLLAIFDFHKKLLMMLQVFLTGFPF